MAGQSLGRSACDDCDVEGATILVPVLLVADENGAKLDVSVPSTMIHCSMCGMWLVTGASTLRVTRLGRGKTRRRRASRQKAVDQARKKSISKSGGKKWTEAKDINGPGMNQVNNGSCRNAIVLTCGYCGTKQKMRGQPNRVRTKKEKISASTRKTQTKNVKHSEEKDHDLGLLDVVPLPNRSKDNATLSGPGKKDHLDKSKSKKAKKSFGKKSGLLDFLSSLND